MNWRGLKIKSQLFVLPDQPVQYPAFFRFRRSLLPILLAALMSGTVLSASVAYTYDQLGRLATATYSNGVVITYVYDSAGNRTSYVTTGAP